MKYMIRFFYLLLLSSCAVIRPGGQGIEGQVIWIEGNRMPGTNQVQAAGIPVRRTLYIYSLTNRKEAQSLQGIFFQHLKSRLIRKVKSGHDGHFKANLPEGTYSLFTGEKKGLYANRFDGGGNINPFTVKKGEYSRLEVKINYEAFY